RHARVTAAPSVPVAELDTGVLYDALDLASLDPAARRRANRRILVVSALFGALRLTDRVPPYRLSMAVNLPGTGPLAGHWRQPLAEELPAVVGRGLVIDCRSSTYEIGRASCRGSGLITRTGSSCYSKWLLTYHRTCGLIINI